MEAADIIDILSTVTPEAVAEAIEKLENRKSRAVAEFNAEITKLKRLRKMVNVGTIMPKRSTKYDKTRPVHAPAGDATSRIVKSLEFMQSATAKEIAEHAGLKMQAVAVCLRHGRVAGRFECTSDGVWTIKE